MHPQKQEKRGSDYKPQLELLYKENKPIIRSLEIYERQITPETTIRRLYSGRFGRGGRGGAYWRK